LSIADKVREVTKEIRAAALGAGRDPASVRLVGVTKTNPPEKVREGYEAGLRLFGESYIQEALPKIEALPKDIEWHMVGHLQSNKAKQAVGVFSMVHTLDRPSLAVELNKAALQRGVRVKALLQANLAGEQSKHGTDAEGAAALARRASEWPGIEIVGLMSIPPYEEAPEESRKHFRALAELSRKIDLMRLDGVKMEHLSMGMSNDFRVAVEEGATLVRVGSLIFGERC
jgi:pyridoxal phosphate enzyme (YggS family)